MPALTCYRIRSHVGGRRVKGFGDAVDLSDRPITVAGPVAGTGFTAQAYIIDAAPRPVAWAGFIQSGFPGLELGRSKSPSALVMVRARVGRQFVMFAFAFGVAGRHLLRDDAYERGYGLRTALNLLYPKAGIDAARLRSVDSKRRGATILRSRFQVSDLSEFEAFNVNYLRDVVGKATGVPADATAWGRRVGGGDSLALNVDLSFEELGEMCRRIEAAHALDDYRDRFDWIDFIQPITDPELVDQLQDEVIGHLKSGDLAGLDLAPPEIVDWDRVAAFRYHFDRAGGPSDQSAGHTDLMLAEYRDGLARAGQLQDLTVARLRSRPIRAVDGDGSEVLRWSAWKCLVGEFRLRGDAYVLDEGEFFRVRADYLAELDDAIDGVAVSDVDLPPSTPTTVERDYNRLAAARSAGFVLLDRDTVHIPGRTTAIEVCDLLSDERQLVHVKRHLGSSDLSHLFAQGMVSAELLQMNPAFRSAAHAKVMAASGGRAEFTFFDVPAFVPANFEIVFAIIAAWRGRTRSQALPFFSKVNLREVATNLHSRGFRVALNQVEA